MNSGQLLFQQIYPMTTNLSLARKPRLPRLRRSKTEQLPGFRITPRDLVILQAVLEFRVLDTRQLHALFLAPEVSDRLNSRLQYRLQMLYQHGYLLRSEQPQTLAEGRKPLLYWLDERGAELLAGKLGAEVENLDWSAGDYRVSHPFLEHLLATNDVRVSVTLAARQNGFALLEWLDDKSLKSPQMKDYVTITGSEGRRQKAAVVPDGYFRLQTREDRFNFLLEVDRRTVTGEATKWGRRDWARKVRAYLAYYSEGKYQERYSTADMRVLTVTTGEKRLTNLKGVTESAGGRGRFWFTTFAAIQAGDILTAPIWQVAGRQELHFLVQPSS